LPLAAPPVPSPLASVVIATVHPSSVLRADDADRKNKIARFTADLKIAAKLLKRAHAA
jgi:DNA polymerase